MRSKSVLVALCAALLGTAATKSKAADAYWLDQYNVLLYLSTFRIDRELKEMSQEGTKTLLVHADSLPSPISRFIAWRAKEVGGMESIAWIQRPNRNNLNRAAALTGFKGVQIDDHYFNDPPVSIRDMRKMLGKKQLWCSFQPKQFSFSIANKCDQSDVQIYRSTCRGTGDLAWKMGITGNSRIAVAAYNDGSKEGNGLINCIEKDLMSLGTDLFVFKWKNQEVWSKQVWKFVSQPLNAIKSLLILSPVPVMAEPKQPNKG